MPGTERPWLRELIGPEIAADFLGRSQDELFPLQLVVLVLIIQAQPPHRFTPGVTPIPHGYLQLPVGVGRYDDLDCRELRSQSAVRRRAPSARTSGAFTRSSLVVPCLEHQEISGRVSEGSVLPGRAAA
jgi:hypothetical protein